jgi:hypothetical protein
MMGGASPEKKMPFMPTELLRCEEGTMRDDLN